MKTNARTYMMMQMRMIHNHRTRRIKDVWQYTEIDDDGFVTLHIDNDDERVFVIMENGERKEIGTEWDKETYTEGNRVYIKRNSGLHLLVESTVTQLRK